jgi:hypothetical protein
MLLATLNERPMHTRVHGEPPSRKLAQSIPDGARKIKGAGLSSFFVSHEDLTTMTSHEVFLFSEASSPPEGAR